MGGDAGASPLPPHFFLMTLGKILIRLWLGEVGLGRERQNIDSVDLARKILRENDLALGF
jgi:hypothetical protein